MRRQPARTLCTRNAEMRGGQDDDVRPDGYTSDGGTLAEGQGNAGRRSRRM